MSASTPTNSSSLTVSTIPPGATDESGTLNDLHVTGITVPANGSVTLVFTVVVDASSPAFSTVSFSATVSNTPQPDVILNAASLTVRRGLVKELYLGPDAAVPAGTYTAVSPAFGAQTMTRFESSNTTPIQVAGGATETWLLDLPLASPLTLEDVTGSSIPVQLALTRPSNGSKSATVSLYRDANCDRSVGPGDLLATSGATSILSSTSAVETFSLDLSQDEPIAAGQCLLLTVVNNNSSKVFNVLPYSGTPGENSRIDLTVYNFINVDVVQTHPASDNGTWTSPVTNVDGGDEVYFRANVSDPFGYYDVTSADFTLYDPNATVQAGVALMTRNGDDGAAVAYFVYPDPAGAGYNFPNPDPASPAGTWTTSVSADEGLEGTVEDTGTDTVSLNPVLPLLSVEKTVSDETVESGQVIDYTITVSNIGQGEAHNVTVEDDLGDYLSLALNPWANGTPFTFSNSGSGLTGIDSWLYAKGGGYIDPLQTPLVNECNDADNGFDGCVSDVRIIMDSTNTMDAGPTGSAFSIQYRVQAQ